MRKSTKYNFFNIIVQYFKYLILVSEAVKTSLVMTRSCPTTDHSINPLSPSPSNPSIDPQISNPSIDPQISNPSIDPQGSNLPSNPKSVSNHSIDPQGSNLSSNPKSVSNHSLDPQVSNPSPTQTNSKESNLYINPSNADRSNSEPMVSNISSDPRLSISSMDPAYVAQPTQTKTTNPSCTSQNLSTEDNTISTDENIKSANQSQINPTINRNNQYLMFNKKNISQYFQTRCLGWASHRILLTFFTVNTFPIVWFLFSHILFQIHSILIFQFIWQMYWYLTIGLSE